MQAETCRDKGDNEDPLGANENDRGTCFGGSEPPQRYESVDTDGLVHGRLVQFEYKKRNSPESLGRHQSHQVVVRPLNWV
jgi:hypothetical protein